MPNKRETKAAEIEANQRLLRQSIAAAKSLTEDAEALLRRHKPRPAPAPTPT